MRVLTGIDSGTGIWRDFRIPFALGGAKLESVAPYITVTIHGKGTVEIKGLDVYTDSEIEWFNQCASNTILNWGGAIGGCFGGLIGVLCFLVSRGKGRRLMTGLLVFGITTGAILLAAGLVALCLGQPYHVWYPFVLGGGIPVLALSYVFWAVRRGYKYSELRKMQALDM